MLIPPLADLSLDLDNQWSYWKTHGVEGWRDFPSYLDIVIPYAIEIFARHRLTVTVFVVGQDAEIESNQAVLRSLVTAGHEIGNHSFHHEPWLQRYSAAQLRDEFERAERALALITDKPLRGFRGPGFCISEDILNLLSERGYRFDASTLPTFLGPLARAYFFLKSNLSRAQAADRDELFGSLSAGLRPLKPYLWQTAHGRLLELPVSTLPILRTPFHFTYLMFLARYSAALATLYFRMALRLCRVGGVGPSLLLHPLDFIGNDDVPGLEFFPGMDLPGQMKRDLVSRLLGIYAASFTVVPMGVRAEAVLAGPCRRIKVLPATKA